MPRCGVRSAGGDGRHAPPTNYGPWLGAGRIDDDCIAQPPARITDEAATQILDYELWVAKGREVKCAVAHMAQAHFKARIRQLTRRSGGRNSDGLIKTVLTIAHFDRLGVPRLS